MAATTTRPIAQNAMRARRFRRFGNQGAQAPSGRGRPANKMRNRRVRVTDRKSARFDYLAGRATSAARREGGPARQQILKIPLPVSRPADRNGFYRVGSTFTQHALPSGLPDRSAGFRPDLAFFGSRRRNAP